MGFFIKNGAVMKTTRLILLSLLIFNCMNASDSDYSSVSASYYEDGYDTSLDEYASAEYSMREKNRLIKELNALQDIDTYDSQRVVRLFRILTQTEQEQALRQAIYNRAIRANDSTLLTKLNNVNKDYTDDRRIVALQYLLSTDQYIEALTKKLREKIDSL